jgi:hypothetical protein
MDVNSYVVEYWLKERMGEVQAAVIRGQVARSRRTRPPLRVTIGAALVRLGQRLQGAEAGAAKVLAPGGGMA